MVTRLGSFVLFMGVIYSTALSAQVLHPSGYARVVLMEVDRGGLSESTLANRRNITLAIGHAKDYRWEGFVVGGIVLGATGAVIAHGLCSNSDVANSGGCTGRTFAGGILGAAVGVGLGALVGGVFKKGS